MSFPLLLLSLALPLPQFLFSHGRAVLCLSGPWLHSAVRMKGRAATSANRAAKFTSVLYLLNLIAIDI